LTTASNALTRGRLKARHIVLLVHLDAERSVLGAARAANMTQPGASKLLAELEDSLGVALFRRHARGVEPTRYGEIMVRRARAALAEMDRAQIEIDALKSGLMGQAVIGAVLSAGTGLVPAALALIKRQHPGILVQIDIDTSDALIDRLLRAELDVIVARVAGSRRLRELRFEALAGELHHVIAGAKHPLAGKRRLDLAMLANQPWILPRQGSILRDRVDMMFAHHGHEPPRNLVETDSVPVITSVLQVTNTLSAMQQDTAAPYCKAGLFAVLPLSLGPHMEPFGIITRRDGALSPSAGVLLSSLRSAAARMYPSMYPNATAKNVRLA
jgi:DNA-binding transcriptional LysR family regulator